MKKISKTGKILEFAAAFSFILLGAAFRIIPHAPNFTPVAAIALFGGVYFSKKTALVLPLAAMIISDIFIGFYDLRLMAIVYFSFIVCVFLGFLIKKNKKWQTILAGSLSGAFIFFFLTNLSVWMFAPLYAKTFSGLIKCFIMALPFFGNTLLGDLFYTSVFFGAYELAIFWMKKRFAIPKTYATN